MVTQAVQGNLYVCEILDVCLQGLLHVEGTRSFRFLCDMIQFFGQVFGQSN